MGVILSDHLLRLMHPDARAEHARLEGHPNAGRTAQECREIASDRAEKDAQKEISQFLRVSGIWFVNPPMNRKSALPTGAPDFLFSRKQTAMALEVKTNGNKPRPEQSACHEDMRRNGWLVYVVSGAAEVKDIFRAMDDAANPRPIL